MLEHTRRRRPLVDAAGRAGARSRRGSASCCPTPPLTRDQLLLLERDNVVAEGALALADLGIAPKAVEAMVPAYLARFRPGGGAARSAGVIGPIRT